MMEDWSGVTTFATKSWTSVLATTSAKRWLKMAILFVDLSAEVRRFCSDM